MIKHAFLEVLLEIILRDLMRSLKRFSLILNLYTGFEFWADFRRKNVYSAYTQIDLCMEIYGMYVFKTLKILRHSPVRWKTLNRNYVCTSLLSLYCLSICKWLMWWNCMQFLVSDNKYGYASSMVKESVTSLSKTFFL